MTARYALLYADKIEKFCIYFLHSWILGLPDRRDSATRIPGIILFGARALGRTPCVSYHSPQQHAGIPVTGACGSGKVEG